VLSLHPPGIVEGDSASLAPLDAVHMAARTVTFTVLISAAAGLVFGISPAIRAPRIDLQQMLQDCNRGYCGGRGQKRFLDALIIPEVGLSMLLLVAAGLLIRTLTALRSVDPGFRGRSCPGQYHAGAADKSTTPRLSESTFSRHSGNGARASWSGFLGIASIFEQRMNPIPSTWGPH
jgi:hypothetical protein